MSKPFPTDHAMFRLIEKQLVEAINRDHGNLIGELGPTARAVLAEIMGATYAPIESRPARPLLFIPGNGRGT